jgi:hypothetical protein
MTNTKTHKQRITTLRQALAAKYGAPNYTIACTSSGMVDEVHVYSQMPNSIVTGWWLMGDLEQAEYRMGIERDYT